MRFVPLPRLHLAPRPASEELIAPFLGGARILWLEGVEPAPDPVLSQLRTLLGSRCLFAPVRAVPLVGPRPGRNPWAHRADLQQPLRWGESSGLDGEETLGGFLDTQGVPTLGGVVFVGLCAGLADQSLRTLLRQLVPRLTGHAPWLACEPNGRYAPRIARSLLAEPDQRGEGKGTVRSVEELRRLFETSGFGLAGAYVTKGQGRGARLRRRLLGSDAGSDWLLVSGSAIRGGEDLR